MFCRCFRSARPLFGRAAFLRVRLNLRYYRIVMFVQPVNVSLERTQAVSNIFCYHTCAYKSR